MIKEITAEEVWKRIPERIEDSHKGTYGKVMIAAGSRQYRGAAALCTEGALRTGAGIVTLASVEEVFGTVLPRMPEAICMPCTPSAGGSISSSNSAMLLNELSKGYTALLMGCGMTNCPDTRSLVNSLVPAAGCSAVLDADALNACAVSGLPEPAQGCSLIITPHPGEMARLTGLSIADIKKEAAGAASDFSKRNKCVTVLKQHRTIVASPDGQVWINTTGNSGLARGGSGDILAGMIAALLAQGLPPEDAAVCAVWLHGKAAEVCSERRSETAMLPHDIFRALGKLFLDSGRR
ncbi:MAG: NAD(P)H-hydrate dehydratase [Anaerovoracaceae bacterium]|jgi:ADP-dependent NAD(P)H-hydrate dehydratase